MKKITALLLTIACACSSNAKAIEHAEALCVVEDGAGLMAASANGTMLAYIEAHSPEFIACVVTAMKAKPATATSAAAPAAK